MNKIITQKQIESILEEMMALNVPVKSYAGIQKLFTELPPVEEKPEKVK